MSAATLTTKDEDAFLARVRVLQDRIWPAEIPREPHYPFGEIAITDYLRRWAREAPDRDAFIYYGTRLTYTELDRLSDRCAAMLQAEGVGPGDPVAVFMGSCPQFVIAFYGILNTPGFQ
ncbi:MAG: AMP-binding protein, partial [Pseudomonadota bacterium]